MLTVTGMGTCCSTTRAQVYSPSMKPSVNLAERNEAAGPSAQRNRNCISMSPEKWGHLNYPGWQWESRRQKWKPNMCYDKTNYPFCSSPREIKL